MDSSLLHCLVAPFTSPVHVPWAIDNALMEVEMLRASRRMVLMRGQ
jgi:hypothetical protein